MNTPHKHAEVIKKWADGAKIQFKSPTSTQWLDHPDNPDWSLNVDYRVKPQKVKAWVNVHPVNDKWVPGCRFYNTKEEAKKMTTNSRTQQVEIEYEKE